MARQKEEGLPGSGGNSKLTGNPQPRSEKRTGEIFCDVEKTHVMFIHLFVVKSSSNNTASDHHRFGEYQPSNVIGADRSFLDCLPLSPSVTTWAVDFL